MVDPRREYPSGRLSRAEVQEIAAGEQRVRLLGPFSVAHDDPELAWKPLVALDEGSIVVVAWAEVTTPFNGGGSPSLQMAVGEAEGMTENIGKWHADSAYPADGASVSSPVFAEASIGLLVAALPRPARITGPGASLILYFNQGDAPPSAGVARAYALIAEPVE